MNIPEDDPRKPRGDCRFGRRQRRGLRSQRRGFVFESIAAEIISAMIFRRKTVVRRSDMSVVEAKGFRVVSHWWFTRWIALPRRLAFCPFLRSSRDTSRKPYSVLKRGYKRGVGDCVGVFFGIACRCMLYTEKAEDAWKYFYACGIVGILCGYCFVFIAQFLHRLRVFRQSERLPKRVRLAVARMSSLVLVLVSKRPRRRLLWVFHRRRRGVSFRAKMPD